MKLRLFLDEEDHAALAVALRKRGHDAVHTLEEKRLGLSDESQLNFATEENRCLVTFNVGDFVRLHNRWIDEGREHAGIIASKQLPSANRCGGCSSCCKKKVAIQCEGRCVFSDTSRLAGVAPLV